MKGFQPLKEKPAFIHEQRQAATGQNSPVPKELPPPGVLWAHLHAYCSCGKITLCGHFILRAVTTELQMPTQHQASTYFPPKIAITKSRGLLIHSFTFQPLFTMSLPVFSLIET